MKVTGFLIGLFLMMNGMAQKPLVKPDNTQPVKLKDAADTMQYTFGAFIAQWFLNNGFKIESTSLFLRGMDDFYQKKLVYPDSTIGFRMTLYQNNLQKERALAQEKALFASLLTKPGVGMLPNGVRFVIKKTGKGLIPTENDSLVIHMIAKFADNTIVENTYETKQPFVTTLSGLFPGLREPMQLMPLGSVWELFIPSVLAYGDKGTTRIPPNSALIIEAELVEIRPAKLDLKK